MCTGNWTWFFIWAIDILKFEKKMLKPKEKNLNIEKIDFKPPPKEPPNKLIVSSIIKKEVHNTGLNPGHFVVPRPQKGL